VLQVQGVATSSGLPVELYSHAGAEAEQTGRRGLALELPKGSGLYPAAGYTDYVAEDLFNEASGSPQRRTRWQNRQRPPHSAQCFLIQYLRTRIETHFRQPTTRFPKQLHAATAAGFALTIALFIFAHVLDQVGL